MTWLLDTNVISELSKAQPNPHCDAWLEAHADGCYLSTVSLAEMRWGIERLAEGKRKIEMERTFRFLLEDYEGRFYDFDGPAAFEWGRYAAELEADRGEGWWKQFDLRDTQMAAIAREYGLVIATRNTRHFPFCQTVNPFEPEHSLLQ